MGGMSRNRLLCSALLAAVSLAAPASPQELQAWPDYRGPTFDGVAPAGLPLAWSEDEGIAWKLEVPGRGWSTPVHDGRRAWFTTATADGKRLTVLAVDLETGRFVHDRVLFEVEEPQDRNKLNSYASPSCALGSGRVWVHFGNEGTVCLDSETGAEVWRRTDLNCDHMEGPGSSPAVIGELLVIHVDGGDLQYVTALDKDSGETRWRVDRDEDYSGLTNDLRKAYSTPLLLDDGKHIVSSAAKATWCLDVETGELAWKVRHPGFSMSSRPLQLDDVVYLNTGFMKAQLWAVRLGGEGDVSSSHVLWKHKKNVPSMSSIVEYGGRLFLVDDGGIATCVDATSGETEWRERIGGEYSASPLLSGDRIYCFDREGSSTVVRASSDFEVLARNELDDGCMASPVPVGTDLLLRTRSALYRITGPEQ